MHTLIDGDVWLDVNGYMRHGNDDYVHRTMASKVLGRPLGGTECVHHVDGIKHNNENKNLVICQDASYHSLLHAKQRVIELGGNPNTDKYCTYHKTLHNKEEFSSNPSHYEGLHNMCRVATNKYRKLNGLNKDKFNWRARLSQQYRRIFSNYTNREMCKL